MSDPLVVRRSALRMWALAVVAVPFVVLTLDILTGRQLTTAWRIALFPEAKMQDFELRDVILGWTMFAAAAATMAFGLKELVVPRRTLVVRPEEVEIAMSGPFRASTRIGMGAIVQASVADLNEGGFTTPALVVNLKQRVGPSDPWGARWQGQDLIIGAGDWDRDPGEVASAINAAKRSHVEDPV